MREVRIGSAADLEELKLRPGKDQLALVVGRGVDKFELAAMLVRLNSLVQEVRMPERVAASSHFAIVCRQYGIRLIC